MVEVRLEHITKIFGKTIAVNDLNVVIRDKEFFVLLGPSGCGKTTTLNIVAGLEKPTSGRVYFDDEDVTFLPPEERNIAMVFQSYALYPTMTAYDNIAFPLKIRRLPRDEIHKRVREVAEMLRIEHLLDKKPHQMSGGERQRVALARAIVRQPRLFLMDEPLSNIDAKLRITARTELIRLQRELGVTTIYVTHDQTEAFTMGHRIGVMFSGRLLQVGSPLEIFECPVNTTVAGFIGIPPMNFIEGHIVYDEGLGKFYFKWSEIALEVESVVAEKAGGHGKSVIAGIRPQNLQIIKGESYGKVNLAFKAKVYTVERLGTESVIVVSVGGELLRAIAPPELTPSLDEDVVVKIVNPSKVLFFNKSTGDLIA
ncbi:MAG: ABC transporter ATP-binding protein [Desulfurococcaceae archaeon]